MTITDKHFRFQFFNSKTFLCINTIMFNCIDNQNKYNIQEFKKQDTYLVFYKKLFGKTLH